MKITIADEAHGLKTFSALKPGDVFKYNNAYWLKVNGCVGDNVVLMSGDQAFGTTAFDLSTKVRKVEAELIIS